MLDLAGWCSTRVRAGETLAGIVGKLRDVGRLTVGRIMASVGLLHGQVKI